MFFWIIYLIFAFVGIEVGPALMQALAEWHAGPGPHPMLAHDDSILFLFGTVTTTILFAVYQKKLKAYRHLPFICFIGFFSFAPGYLVVYVFFGLLYLVDHLPS